jgi:hypothetical protein
MVQILVPRYVSNLQNSTSSSSFLDIGSPCSKAIIKLKGNRKTTVTTVCCGINLALGWCSFSQDVNYPNSNSSWISSVPPCTCVDNASVLAMNAYLHIISNPLF